jgi:hypothetical protein
VLEVEMRSLRDSPPLSIQKDERREAIRVGGSKYPVVNKRARASAQSSVFRDPSIFPKSPLPSVNASSTHCSMISSGSFSNGAASTGDVSPEESAMTLVRVAMRKQLSETDTVADGAIFHVRKKLNAVPRFGEVCDGGDGYV